MKQTLSIFILCFFMIKATGQDLIVKTFANLGNENAPIDGATLHQTFSGTILGDGLPRVSQWLCPNDLSTIPSTFTSFIDFDNAQVVAIGSMDGYITKEQADALIGYVKLGGVLLGSMEGLKISNLPNSTYAVKYIAEALFCNTPSISISVSPKGSLGIGLAPAFHPDNGVLLLNTLGGNTIGTSTTFSQISGIPSENAIMLGDPQPRCNCGKIQVLDMIVPAYPGLLTGGVNNSCGIKGFALLSGECYGPLTYAGALITGGTGRTGSQLNKNYAQLIYDFYYNKPALQARYNWAVNGCVNQRCIPTPPNGQSVAILPSPVIDPAKTTIFNVCPNTAVTADLNATVISSTPAGATLEWFTNSIHSGTPYATPTTASKGIYYAYYHYTATGCYSGGCAVVNLQEHSCDACTVNFENANPQIISNVNGPISGNNYVGLQWITNDIVIDGSTDFTNAEILVEPNVSIKVTDNALLKIISSHLYTCVGRWNGFIVESKASMQIDGTNTVSKHTSSLIEDAEIAINSSMRIPIIDAGGGGGVLSVNNTIFNRNNIAIQINDYNATNNGAATLPFHITNTLFTCRNIPFYSTQNTWDNLKQVSNNYYGTYPATPNRYTQPYILNANYPDDDPTLNPEAYLKDNITLGAYTTQKSFIGIQLNNVNGFSSFTTPASIQIGDANGSDAFPNVTIFDNLQFGIMAEKTNLALNNCSFQKPVGEGMGIYVNNNLSDYVVDISTPLLGTPPNNAFFNMKTAINISGGKTVNIDKCDIRSNQSYNDIESWAYLEGQRGIVVYNHHFENINITNNKIHNIKYPIKVFSARDKGSVPDPISIGAINVFKNNINTVLAGATDGSGQEYVKNGIDISSLYIHNSNNFPINCNENELYNVLNGIRLSNWKRTNTLVQKNTVTLAQHPTNATYVNEGITLEGGFGSSLGFDENDLPLGSNTDNIVYDNNVTGTGTTGFSVAIKLAQQSNTNVGCNKVHTAQHGFMFEGANLLTKFFDNIIDVDNNYGVTLTNDGSIGKQGNETNTTATSDDVCTSNNSFTDAKTVGGSWDPASGQYMIYCNKSLPSKSIFVLRSGYPELDLGTSSNSDVIPPLPINIYSPTNGTIYTNNSPGNNCDRCVGSNFYPRKRNKTLLEEIADGTVLLPIDDADDRLRAMQQQLYDLIKAKPELIVNATSLQQFIYDNHWTSLDFIHYAGRYVAKGDMDMVKTLLGFWPGQEKLDDNYYRYFDWLVKMYENPDWMPSENEVFEMANKCPIKDGLIVYAARNLYNSMIKEVYKFENRCEGNNAARGVKQATQFIRLKQPKVKANEKQETSNIIIYPNPAKSILNIACNNIKQVTIVDALGKVVMQQDVKVVNNMQLNIEPLQKGIFLVKVVDVNNKVHTTKFIKE